MFVPAKRESSPEISRQIRLNRGSFFIIDIVDLKQSACSLFTGVNKFIREEENMNPTLTDYIKKMSLEELKDLMILIIKVMNEKKKKKNSV